MAKGKYKKWLEEDSLTLLRAWARNGLTDEEIAKKIGISKQTFYDWQKKYPDFSDSVKKGKDIYDFEIEEELHKSAKGYWVEETISEKTTEDDGITRESTRTVRRWVQPSITAQIFWLKNRKPGDWRDKREVELSGDIGISDALKKARERVNNIPPEKKAAKKENEQEQEE